MRLKKIIEAADAVAVIHAGDTVASAGYAGSGTPDQLFHSIEQRFLESGTPRDLTLVFSTGQGDMKDKGLNRLAHMEDRLSYDLETNTVCMNYSGLRVRDLTDLETIGAAVDALLGPLGKRVHSVVNYERFTCDDDVFDEYVELVKRVEQTYYLSVKRYTSGAFLRHKLGTELSKRHISSEILHPSGRKA
jgi:hypothetical protein